MITADRHLEWRHFRELIDQGIPAVQPVSGTPEVMVFVDEGGSRIGLRTPASAGYQVDPSPLAEIHIGLVTVSGKTLVEVTTRAAGLFAEFYALLEELADRLQLQGQSAEVAFKGTLANWKALLRPADRMSDEHQVGLFGELLVLDRIVATYGPDAIHAWTGPVGEQHDFRLANNELEVKTTNSRKRVHMISSLEQLEPSPGRQLHMISIQVEPAGNEAGSTLPEMVDRVRAMVPGPSQARDTLDSSLLVGWRFSDVHAPFYGQRLQLRAPVVLVPITQDFPRLIRSVVATLPQSERLSNFHYQVNVEGLGYPDGTSEFLSVLPAGTPL
jgi:hypothetical protein